MLQRLQGGLREAALTKMCVFAFFCFVLFCCNAEMLYFCAAQREKDYNMLTALTNLNLLAALRLSTSGVRRICQYDCK
jgi:hypothetical protein